MEQANLKRVPYPGITTTTDGAGAVVWVETHITQGACAYPITSSTTMGQGYQIEVSNGRTNLWGEPLVFLELESEHSSASTCEGFALAGGRVSNFTSGQGLVLMKEVLYTISGKRLPAVFHIGARALTSHSLNVHAGHDDVMAVADCGWGMLFARTAQETGDLALIARRAAEDSETPFLNVQDGFLTTHTVEKVQLSEPEMMQEYIGSPAGKLRNLMDVNNPIMTGVVQNQDSYMKGKIAQRYFYDQVAPKLRRAFDEFYRLTGRRYDFFDTYRLEDAEYAIIGMGSYMETAAATVDYLRSQEGMKVGVVSLTCFRPFPSQRLVEALKHVQSIAVLERMDNPLAQSNPLACELKAAFADALTGLEGYPAITRLPRIIAGSGGLGSRDVRPGDFIAIFEHISNGSRAPYFAVGIDHPLALKRTRDPDIRPKGSFSMRGHSVGGYGSVTTNKIIASLTGDLFGLEVQAYPKYGSEKKGLPTTYYLSIGQEKIRTHCELEHVDFVVLNDVNAFNLGNPLSGLDDHGVVFVQTSRTTPEEVWADIPPMAQSLIRRKQVRVLGLDTVKIAKETATSASLIQRMQGIVLLGVFLRVTPYQRAMGLDDEQLMEGVERSLRKYFGNRGEQVIQDNLTCVRRGYDEVFEVPPEVMEHGASSVTGLSVVS
ncbi:MAG: 2-oxoacid:acceptor oxidoreductase family protein [Candidatus Tectomicrobia bacterium]|nr:2-oxoacid:acceptor oxidoreductase family protein [Candidatus Tectomicrobia bacterium]